MPTRSAQAVWEGDLKSGKGNIKGSSGAIDVPYSFGTRFENAPGTNPEELIAAAHSGCYSMALAHTLASAGTPATRVHTTAQVTIEKVGEGFKITRIKLVCEAMVPGVEEGKFRETAQAVKSGCPVSGALAAVPIELEARLVK